MNKIPFGSSNEEFGFLDLRAKFAFKTRTSISFYIGRWSDADQFTFVIIGWIDVHHPCEDHIRAQIRMRIPKEYHQYEKLQAIVEAIFGALAIPADETFDAMAFDFDSDSMEWIQQHTDRDGVSWSI